MSTSPEPYEKLEVPVFTGGPYERGKRLVEHFAPAHERLLKQLNAAVRLREQNGEQEWLMENWLRTKAVFPDVAAYLLGQADGLGVSADDLVASTHFDLLKDRDKARRAGKSSDAVWDEECSTFAFPVAGAGALVAKNRDNPPGASDRHTIALHRDPSWDAGWVLAVSSVGSPMSASSAMNGHGLIMVCNAARPRVVGNGFIKAFVADAFLSQCRTVDEALAMIRAVRHTGEGNMIIGDKSGKVAAIGMLGDEPIIEVPQSPGWVARTNHFDGDCYSHLNQRRADNPRLGRNSRGRLRYLRESFSRLPMPWCNGWDEATKWAVERLSFQDESGEATLCFDSERMYTSSAAVFCSNPPSLLISDGPPTRGIWRFWQPDVADGPQEPIS